jgi:hypothetical protein
MWNMSEITWFGWDKFSGSTSSLPTHLWFPYSLGKFILELLLTIVSCWMWCSRGS